jgi:hypothetical protein
MSEHKTLLQFLLDLLHDKQALADFKADPQGELHAAGLEHVCVQDIQDLLPVVLEKEDPQKCAKYEDDCDKGQCHDDGPRDDDGHHGGHQHDHDPGHDDHKWQHDHDSEIDKVITHLNYVTNNYSYDSHDTIYNTDNITKIWADHGAKVDVTNDTHNVGAGGVSIEGDNNAPVATGGHNQIGHDNQMSGDGSTTSFGNGAAQSHVSANDGGAVSGNGPASGNNAPTTNFGDGAQVAGQGASASDSHAESNSHNSTDSHDVTKTSTDSHNNTNSQNHGSFDTDSSTHLHTEDSHNTETDNSADNSTNVDHGHIDNGLLFQ